MWEEIEIKYAHKLWTVHVNSNSNICVNSNVNNDKLQKWRERVKEYTKANVLHTQTFKFSFNQLVFE